MNYWSKVDGRGYKILKNIVAIDDIFTIRKNLDNFFINKPYLRMLNLEDSIQAIGLVENIQLNETLLSSISCLFPDGNWKFVNDFQVLKNMASEDKGGWHADCNSQYSMSDLNKKMSLNEYKFLKIGFYFQGQDCQFGSSIEVIPYSHLLPKWGYKILTSLLNKTNFGIYLSKLISINLDNFIESGDCVLFDCRLIHRSSPANNMTINTDIYDKSLGAYKIHVPGKNKYAFYFEAGDSKSCLQFLKSNNERVKDDKEGFFIEYLFKTNEFFFNTFSSEYKRKLLDKIAFLKKED